MQSVIEVFISLENILRTHDGCKHTTNLTLHYQPITILTSYRTSLKIQ